MNATQLYTLIQGGNITRWTTLERALEQTARQPYFTMVLLGCDGRYWVPATPRITRLLIAVGYEAAV